MLPIPGRPRAVRAFEVITPAGRVYRYPRPSLLQHLAAWLSLHANTIAVSVAILTLIYAAGFAAEALDRSAFSQCNDASTVPTGTS
ncbi:hypothetical protein JQ628_15280 [Bradyrhizobium lablabi]|uniref:hypothetical protein n=1 Tax=Bradyrhizobium lablabi TaxID=722472 RepID=UPI001BA63826|nr:hypothetical protein [Bradyrhizobium lablabi]MBR1122889.1 hypothetical protein [Bradyrhizobium lablabi]